MISMPVHDDPLSQGDALPPTDPSQPLRLAGDLHDGLLQYVIAARMMIESLRNRLRASAVEVPPEIDSAENYLQQAIAEGRRLIEQLHGHEPAAFDWVDAIRRLVRELNEEGEIDCEFHLAGTVPTDAVVADVLYRAAQESLSNIRRHSRARSARLTLVCSADLVRLEITDDGQGFDADAPHHNDLGKLGTGRGLSGLRRRAETLGGRLEIHSTPSRGTRLSMELPVRLNSNKGDQGPM